MKLTDFAIKRPIATIMLFSCLVILGFISLKHLPLELMPNYDSRFITVIIQIRGGIPATEVETMVTQPIEEVLGSVNNLKEIVSQSKEGLSIVSLKFEPQTNMDFASLEVREKLARIKNKLPKEIEKPIIAKFQQQDLPVMILALTSTNKSPEQLRQMVDERIKDRFMKVEGVANVEVSGGRERKILVEINQGSLAALNIPVEQVVGVLNLSNLNLSVGELTKEDPQNKYVIRAIGEFQNLSEIKNLGIATTANNSIIRLKDIAGVYDSYLEPASFARINYNPTVSLYIQKESQANTIKVVQNIESEIKKLSQDEDTKLEIVSNQALFIKKAINNVKFSLFSGAILATLILLCFLCDLAAVSVILLSIPISLITSFSLLYWQKISLNIMTLAGLALGVGMVVDSSVVVLENIFRKREKGLGDLGDKKAALLGTKEVSLAIIASILTTVIIFLPLVFVNPQIRILYKGLALAVSFALILSLFVSLMLVPMLLGNFRFSSPGFLEHKIALLKKYNTNLYSRLKTIYQKKLGLVLRQRYRFIRSGFALFGLALFLAFIFPKLGMDFIGSLEREEFTIFIELPTGAKLEASDRVVNKVEEVLSKIPEIKTVSARIEPWSSRIYVNVIKRGWFSRPTPKIIDSLRPHLKKIRPAFIYFEESDVTQAREIILDIFGYDYGILTELAYEMAKELEQVRGLEDVKIRMREGRPQMNIVLDKQKAGYFGLYAQDVSDTLHAKLRGLRATKYHTDGGREIEVITRLNLKDRTTFDDVKRTTLYSPLFKNTVYLGQVCNFNFDLGPSEIWRKNKFRMVQVSATSKFNLEKTARIIKKRLKHINFSKDYFYQFGGSYPGMQENKRQLFLASLLALILVYFVLAALFESYRQPFIILITLPLALIGVVAILFLFHQPITIGVLIGVIILFGIVVNNAIVMVDHINQLRQKKLNTLRSVIAGTQDRLRPILITSLTTVFGLIPLAIDRSGASNLWAPLALTLIGGLTCSTFLSLFLVPCMYLASVDLKNLKFSASGSSYLGQKISDIKMKMQDLKFKKYIFDLLTGRKNV